MVHLYFKDSLVGDDKPKNRPGIEDNLPTCLLRVVRPRVMQRSGSPEYPSRGPLTNMFLAGGFYRFA